MGWVWPAVNALVGVYSAYTSNKNQKKALSKSASQKDIEGTLASNLQQTSPIGLDLLGDSADIFDTLQSTYEPLASGRRTSALEFLGPSILEGDQARRDAFSADMNLGGRGAGAPEQRIGLIDDAVQRRENALMSLKPWALDQLSNLAAAKGSLATSVLGQSSSGGLGLLGAILGRQGQAFDQDRATGAALFELLKLFGGKFGGGGGGSSSTQSMPSSSSLNQYMDWAANH